MYSSIGIWDFGFFFVIFLIGILATYFHWTHAMHAIRRRGSVGANCGATMPAPSKARTKANLSTNQAAKLLLVYRVKPNQVAAPDVKHACLHNC